MPSGKPGDHPYTDIVVHRLDVFGTEIDDTVRHLHQSLDASGREQLAELLWNSDLWWGNARGSTTMYERNRASERSDVLCAWALGTLTFVE